MEFNFFNLLSEGIEMLKSAKNLSEAAPDPMASPPAPEAPAMPPVAPPGPAAAPPSPEGQPSLTVDTVISKLNMIRRGRSFNDEPMYDQLSSFFNALSEQDKSTLDRLLSQISQVVMSNLPQPTMTPPVGAPPVAPPSAPAPLPPAPPSMSEELRKLFEAGESIDLNEGKMSETATLCDGSEVPYGSAEHIADLQRTLSGLQAIKAHWNRGTSARYLISTTSHRLKKLIDKLTGSSSKAAEG